jgi:ABC-type Fe3+/spermidine/putrescine transport system ATPase subunit
MLLEIENITLLYGRIQALHGISLTVDQGEIVALIGANGAGKTTTMRAVSGLRPVAAGHIRFAGEDITKLRADLRTVRGISQAPEGRGIFPGMSVLENLEMGAYTRRDAAGIRSCPGGRSQAVPRTPAPPATKIHPVLGHGHHVQRTAMPATARPATTYGTLTLQPSSTATVTTAMAAVTQSVMVCRDSTTTMPAIAPAAAAVAPVTNAWICRLS